MIRSLVSTMQAQMQRHEILANNLANASTAGFKQDGLLLLLGNAAPAGASAPWPASPGGGQSFAQWTDLSQALIRETERPLDVALDGAGFLVVQTPRGERYTRAGALTVNRDGQLATASGHPVLGDGGPLAIRSARPSISDRGEVHDDGQPVGTLRVVEFPRSARLLKEGDSLFVPADRAVAPAAAREYRVVAGALEESNVNAVRSMVEMIELLRSYESAQRAIQAVDEAEKYAVNDMGRV
jgi:flagellar basal-body rod protein FlgG